MASGWPTRRAGGTRCPKRKAYPFLRGYPERQPIAPPPSSSTVDSLGALAEWADYLIIATPGGAGTRHLVDAKVPAQLGPGGFVVNIARGSVLDTAALAHALRAGKLGGAGLDVYESEPEPPAELFDCPNVVLTPHVAARSPEAIDASVRQFQENSRLHFAGEPVRTPVG